MDSEQLNAVAPDQSPFKRQKIDIEALRVRGMAQTRALQAAPPRINGSATQAAMKCIMVSPRDLQCEPDLELRDRHNGLPLGVVFTTFARRREGCAGQEMHRFHQASDQPLDM